MKWLVLVFAIGCSAAPATGPANRGGKPEGDPYAMVVLVQGWELWMGNDQLVKPDDPSYYKGGLDSLKAAFAGSTFAAEAPGGSQAALLTYADKVTVRVPLGTIDKLRADAFGTQKTYYNTMGSELVLGVVAAAGELGKTDVPRKYLIVIGDGSDTNNDAANGKLATLKAELAAKHITVLSFVYKTKLSSEDTVIKALADDTVMLESPEGLTVRVKAALDGLAKRGH